METVLDPSTGMPHPRRAARQLEAVRRGLRSRRFFTLYFGLGIPPALFGSVGVAYRLGIGAGVVATVVVGAWLFETFATVCRRCPFYATTKCGLPGMVVPLIFGRRSAHEITRRRIAVHRGLDLAMVGFVNVIYLLALPALWPLIALCTVVGWVFVLRPKRFHGLAHRLRTEPRHGTVRGERPAAPVAVTLRTGRGGTAVPAR